MAEKAEKAEKAETLERIEAVMDRTVEDVFLEKMERSLKGVSYTLFTEVQGLGESGPRRGTHVWPEENSVFILYIPAEVRGVLEGLLREMREEHPGSGIAVFAVPGAREIVID